MSAPTSPEELNHHVWQAVKETGEIESLIASFQHADLARLFMAGCRAITGHYLFISHND
jgi:hypothetical protein